MKKLFIIPALAILVGCGGSGSGNSMSDKKYIVVLKNVKSGVCESKEYRDILKSKGLIGLKTQETGTDTDCSTYGKTNDGQFCEEVYNSDGDKNCVVGFDDYNGDASFRKTSQPNKTDISDLDPISVTVEETIQSLGQ